MGDDYPALLKGNTTIYLVAGASCENDL